MNKRTVVLVVLVLVVLSMLACSASDEYISRGFERELRDRGFEPITRDEYQEWREDVMKHGGKGWKFRR